jgi:hypothetical protein
MSAHQAALGPGSIFFSPHGRGSVWKLKSLPADPALRSIRTASATFASAAGGGRIVSQKIPKKPAKSVLSARCRCAATVSGAQAGGDAPEL